MTKIFGFAILSFFVLSCNKNNSSQVNTTSICLDTTFINTNMGGLQSIYFLNDKDGFVSTYNGGLYKTTDSASTWTTLHSNTNLPIRGICFIDAQTGFAVGGLNSCGGTGCTPPGGFILKTTDGGQSWINIYTPADKIEITTIYFVNATLGFCAGDNIVFKTTDGGQTWNEYKINNPGGKMMQIKFINSQKGYIACLFDKIITTEDGGLSWQVTSPNRGNGYYSISASNGSTFVSGQGKIIKSTNGGVSWSELPNSPSDIYDIHFLNDRTGFAFGRGNYSGGDFGYFYGSMYCTDNGGNTWNGTAEMKEVGLIQSASFPSNKIGYAISGNKVIRLTVK
jgi:photosystem II stability/assembly factor-like uncharacterized protein